MRYLLCSIFAFCRLLLSMIYHIGHYLARAQKAGKGGVWLRIINLFRGLVQAESLSTREISRAVERWPPLCF